MKALNFITEFFLSAALLLIFSSWCCHGDTNMKITSMCSTSDNSTTGSNLQPNLKNLLDSLAENGPLQNGFYTTSVGERSNQLHGLIQCRGDISANNCAICTKNVTETALSECPRSREAVIWFKWCFLRFSTENLAGVLRTTLMPIVNRTDNDVVSNGLQLMSGLASSAPNRPLMFETAVLDGGGDVKRFGMAQCTRDISKSDCNRCLSSALETLTPTIANKKNWEIYGLSCSLWYHDYQFYFNSSTSASARWPFPESGRTMFISFAVLMVLIIL